VTVGASSDLLFGQVPFAGRPYSRRERAPQNRARQAFVDGGEGGSGCAEAVRCGGVIASCNLKNCTDMIGGGAILKRMDHPHESDRHRVEPKAGPEAVNWILLGPQRLSEHHICPGPVLSAQFNVTVPHCYHCSGENGLLTHPLVGRVTGSSTCRCTLRPNNRSRGKLWRRTRRIIERQPDGGFHIGL